MELGDARTELRRQLVDAVLRGEKTATAGLYADAEPLPRVGDKCMLLDFDDEPVAVGETTEVRVLRSCDVDLAFAIDEGEGFETLADWRRAHEEFWAEHEITDDTLIVAERFKLVERLNPGAPMSEEQMRAVTIGELRPLSGPVLLVEYDPEWPRLFEGEATRIRTALGAAALQIEHVGSTSVPGIAAKPVIDILLVVEDSADEDTYVPPLEAAGYVLRIREPEFDEHRLFKGPETDVNLHVFSRGSAEIDRFLIFRDRLRSNEPDRELYLRTKRELAQKEWKFTQNYADAKRAVVEEILARARRQRAY
jgi:GrpB-like predicted nucleotidyltransferase (UPF0157 family)/uncharacterized protein YhfF